MISLASRYGIEIPKEDVSPGQLQREAKIKRLYKINEMALEYYHCYFVKLFGIKGYTLIYAMPNQEDELYSLNYSGLDKITIGSDQTCNICFNYPLVQNVQATIEKENNEYVIKSGENLKLQVFLNDKQVRFQ